MKTKNAIVALAAAAALAGCRKHDFKRDVIDIPGMTESNTNEIAAAMNFYEGVLPQHTGFDLAKKQATVVYDSLKVARMNLLMAIAEKGIDVTVPVKTSGPAGYIDERPERVE